MQVLTDWIMGGNSPILITLLLGVLFSLEPHALMTNVAAIGYIGQNVTNRKLVFRNALLYIIGRTLSYGIIGLLFWFLIKKGFEVDSIAHLVSHYGLYIIVPFMIIMGLFLLFHIHLPHIHFKLDKFNEDRINQPLGSFALGALLSLAFCPANALLFFGFVIPLTVNSSFGVLLIVLFALITAVPVVIIAWFIAFSISHMPTISKQFKRYNNNIRRIIGLFFIIISIMLFLTQHSHHDNKDSHISNINIENRKNINP